MGSFFHLLVFLLWTGVQCQNGDDNPSSEVETPDGSLQQVSEPCSCSGSIAGAVIITAIAVLVLIALIWCFYGSRAKGRGHGKVDPEAASRAAYDNPQFQGDDLDQSCEVSTQHPQQPPCQSTPKGTTPAKVAPNPTNTSPSERGKITIEKVMAAVISGGKSRSPRKTKDDSYIQSHQITVPLQGHDFTGLGFTIYGNLREGIFVKEVMNRGPANESKQVRAGDRLMALTVLTDHMVFEDALTILSYASPYPVLLHLEKNQNIFQILNTSATPPKGKKMPSPFPPSNLIHPVFRSQSHGDVAKIGSMDIRKLQLGNIASPKCKQTSIAMEEPKISDDLFSQRDCQERHSERAIDVPGVEVNAKRSIDAADTIELANVQVHRSMSPPVGIEMPAEIITSKHTEAEITDTRETIPTTKIDSRFKFGVKVLPDLGLHKHFKKEIDPETGVQLHVDSPDSSKCLPTVHIERENETKSIKLTGKAPDACLEGKLPNFKISEKSALGAEISGKIPTPAARLSKEAENNKENGKSKGKFGFGIGKLDFKADTSNLEDNKKKYDKQIKSDKEHSVVEIPEFDIKVKSTDPKTSKDSQKKQISGANEPEPTQSNDKSKGSFDFKLKKSEINFPAFSLKKDKVRETEQHELDNTTEKDKEKQIKVKRKGSKNDGDSSGFGFSIKNPDIKLPSFDFRHGKNKEEDEEGKETEEERKKRKDQKKSKERPSFNFKFKSPDFSFPHFGTKDDKKHEDTDVAKSEVLTTKVENEELDVDEPKMNIDLSLNMPNFSEDVHLNKDVSDGPLDVKGVDASSIKVNMPSTSLPQTSKIEVGADVDRHEEVSIQLPSYSMVGALTEEVVASARKPGEISLETSSRNDITNLAGTIISKDENLKVNEDSKLIEVPLAKPGINKQLPYTASEDDERHSKNEKKKSKFSMKLPDVSFPSFGFDRESAHKENKNNEVGVREDRTGDSLKGVDGSAKPSNTIEETIVVNLNVGGISNVESKTEKSDEKSKNKESDTEGGVKGSDNECCSNKNKKRKGFGFKMKAPEFEMPDFKLKHGHKQYGLESKEVNNLTKNSEQDTAGPPQEEKYIECSDNNEINCSTSDNVVKDSSGDSEAKKKKHFGFNIKMPEITIPDFKFKSNAKHNDETSATANTTEPVKSLMEKKLDLDLEIENENNENASRDKEEASIITNAPMMSESLESDIVEKTLAKLEETKDLGKLGIAVHGPGLPFPNISASIPTESNEDNVQRNIQSNSETMREADIPNSPEEDLNVTDATKKKRFGIKSSQPTVALPHLKINQNVDLVSVESESFERNQSDEIKSLHLKMKAPNAPEATSENIRHIAERLSMSELSTSAELKVIDIPEEDLQRKSDEWKIKERNDSFKSLEQNENKKQLANEFASDTAREQSFQIRPSDLNISTGDHQIRRPILSQTTKEIFGVKLKSSKFPPPSCPEETLKNESDQNNSTERANEDRKISEAKLEFSNWAAENSSKPYYEVAGDLKLAPSALIETSSLEIESDLPEADSDLKMKSMELPEVDVSLAKFKPESAISKSPELDVELLPNFNSQLKGKQKSNTLSLSSDDGEKDLPEVDIAMCSHILDEEIELIPENSSILNFPDLEEQEISPRIYDYSSDSDVEKSKLKSNIKELEHGGAMESDIPEVSLPVRPRRINDDEKSKTKGKQGFGFKAFSKSSDSEDNEQDSKISRDPKGHSLDNKDKKRQGGKINFGFKVFGKSSSDTEEENSSNTNRSMVPKAKSSESEEGNDNEILDDKGFVIQRKSKHLTNPFEEEGKSKSKTLPLTAKPSTKDSKNDEDILDEGKISAESKGDDTKIKQKYGLGFGFRKISAKSTSDSEGAENDEKHVSLDAKGSNNKPKEPKSKNIKMGFKGLKNLKGRIQTEFNKIRHESPSSDEEAMQALDDSNIHGEKRKKITKKKDKDKKAKRDDDYSVESLEEITMTSAAIAAKENRRKKSSHTSSSSSSESSAEEEEKHLEVKKRKKTKGKRDGKAAITGVMAVNLEPNIRNEEVVETMTSSEREVIISSPTFPTEDDILDSTKSSADTKPVVFSADSEPKRYVVVKQMKLKSSSSLPSNSKEEASERIEKTSVERNFPQPLLLEERGSQVNTDTDGGSWGSDSDIERMQKIGTKASLSENSVNLNISGKQPKIITDSDELKRKAASLGDLSTINEGTDVGTVLERAVSLDLKTASDGPSSLHVRRLRLPDSSATSIDEVDEALTVSSPKKLEASSGLKAAGRWGTLEDALLLDKSGYTYQNTDIAESSSIEPTSPTGEGAPISNIEIDGGKGYTVTALSSGRGSWNESFEEESPPALPTSPVPGGTTTITVNDLNMSTSERLHTPDTSIVIIASESTVPNNLVSNVNIDLPEDVNDQSIFPLDAMASHSLSLDRVEGNENINSHVHIITNENDSSDIRYGLNPFSNDINNTFVVDELDSLSPVSTDDTGGVTITMISADEHPLTQMTSLGVSPPPVPPKPKTRKTHSTTTEPVSYNGNPQSQLITVNHDWVKENGDIDKETSDHNLSDEYLTPESSPQKSMTQITLDGDVLSGYTVTEGTISKTVIISNPASSADQVNIVQTDSGSTNFPL